MANLKRNMIELISNPDEVNKGGEPEFDKYWTSPHMSLEVLYEAMDISEEMAKIESGKSDKSFREGMDLMMDFLARKAYNGQFTKKDLIKRLHAPDSINTLLEQISFIANGETSDSTKKFLANKN